MLARTCELVFEAVTRDVSAIGAARKYERCGVKCVEDLWQGQGPLGGILTALLETAKRASVPKWNLILSCDMPFLTEEMLVYCVDRANRSEADVVVPSSARGLEPLCACWRTSVAGALLAVFEQGVRKISDAMEHFQMEVLDERDWKRFDSEGRLFWNMNTAADYEEARRILEEAPKERLPR